MIQEIETLVQTSIKLKPKCLCGHTHLKCPGDPLGSRVCANTLRRHLSTHKVHSWNGFTFGAFLSDFAWWVPLNTFERNTWITDEEPGIGLMIHSTALFRNSVVRELKLVKLKLCPRPESLWYKKLNHGKRNNCSVYCNARDLQRWKKLSFPDHISCLCNMEHCQVHFNVLSYKLLNIFLTILFTSYTVESMNFFNHQEII